MCAQVDAADAQVVAGPDEPGLELQGSCVRLHRLLAAVPVCEGRPQTIPQKVVLEEEASVGVGCDGHAGNVFMLERRRSCSCSCALKFLLLANDRGALLADLLLYVLYQSRLTQAYLMSPEIHHIGRPCCCIPPRGGRAQVTVRSSTRSFIWDEASQRGIIICLCVQSNLFQQGSPHYQVKYAG